MLEEDDFQDKLMELKQEWDGGRDILARRDMAKIKIMMAETQSARIAWSRGKSVSEILEAFPPMEDGTFVSRSFVDSQII